MNNMINEKATSSCQKYLGVFIIDRLQIVYIKINRHHKFLVHIVNWPVELFTTGKVRNI